MVTTKLLSSHMIRAETPADTGSVTIQESAQWANTRHLMPWPDLTVPTATTLPTCSGGDDNFSLFYSY